MSRSLLQTVLSLLLFLGTVAPTHAQVVFRYPESSKPSSLMPFFAENMSAVRLSEFLFESLIVKNKRGDIEGQLAIRWTSDPRVWGLHLILERTSNGMMVDRSQQTMSSLLFKQL